MTTPTGNRTFRVTILTLLVVELFSGVLQTYFTPLYALLGKQYGVSTATLSWALVAPNLALVVLTPVLARLGDIHGHRRLLRVAVGLAGLGAVLVAVVPTFGVLVAGRALQGGIGAYLPLMFGLIAARHPGEPTRKGIGYLSAILLFGALVGTVVTGPLVRAANGPGWALWLPAAGVLAGFVVTCLRRQTETPPSGQRMDWPGALLLGAGLVGFVLGLGDGGHWGWTSGPTVTALVGGVVLLAAWVLIELRVSQPLMDLRCLFQPRLVPVFVIGFLMYFGFLGSQVPNATYLALPGGRLGYGLGLGPLGISLAFVPIFLATTLLAALTSRIGRRIGYTWTVAAGAMLFVVGPVGVIFAHQSLPVFIVLWSVTGAGFGLIEGATRTVVVDELRQGEISVGEGIYELSIGLGSAFGTAVVTAILTANTVPGSGIDSEHGYVVVWTALAAAGVLGAVTAIAYARFRGLRPSPQPAVSDVAEPAH